MSCICDDPKYTFDADLDKQINGSNAGARSLQKSGHVHGKLVMHQNSEEVKANFWHKRYHNRQGKNINNTFFRGISVKIWVDDY